MTTEKWYFSKYISPHDFLPALPHLSAAHSIITCISHKQSNNHFSNWNLIINQIHNAVITWELIPEQPLSKSVHTKIERLHLIAKVLPTIRSLDILQAP